MAAWLHRIALVVDYRGVFEQTEQPFALGPMHEAHTTPSARLVGSLSIAKCLAVCQVSFVFLPFLDSHVFWLTRCTARRVGKSSVEGCEGRSVPILLPLTRPPMRPLKKSVARLMP